MNEIITKNEVMNDGRKIHLYFNGFLGLYAAYGYSAFLLSRITTVAPSYSESMQMPVVVMNATHLEEVKSQLNVVKTGKGYYCLEVEQTYDQDAYDDWGAEIRRGGR